MSDWESALISKACQNSGTQTLIAHGVQTNHFQDDENKDVWRFVTKHITKYKAHPSFDLIKEQFPDYKWQVVVDPLEVIQDKFITDVKRASAITAFRELADVLDENDPIKIQRIDELFLDEAHKLSRVVPSSNISRFSTMAERISLYKERKEQGINVGIPFGIPRLDDMTLGLYPHEYVTIAGWTGLGKSTLALVLSVNHYMAGYTPMFMSLEMGADELYRKLDSMAVGLRQHAMKQMSLTGSEMQRWEEFADRVETLSNDIIIVDVENATPQKIHAETARWNPDVVIVDYVQLVKTYKSYRNMWERIGDVAEAFKAQARTLKIPIYGLAQSSADSVESGARLENLAGSKDIGKHSDLMLGLYQDEVMAEMNKMEIRVDKNRGGRKGSIDMYWNHETCEFRQWEQGDEFREKSVVD